MSPTHPTVTKKIDELLARAKELTIAHQENVDLLSKAIDAKDFWGMKARVSEVTSYAEKIQWVVAQVNALENIPYNVVAVSASRRLSSGSMPAVSMPQDPPKDDDPKD